MIGDWRSPAFHEDGDMGLKRYITRLVKDVDVVIVGTRLTMEVVGYRSHVLGSNPEDVECGGWSLIVRGQINLV